MIYSQNIKDFCMKTELIRNWCFSVWIMKWMQVLNIFRPHCQTKVFQPCLHRQGHTKLLLSPQTQCVQICLTNLKSYKFKNYVSYYDRVKARSKSESSFCLYSILVSSRFNFLNSSTHFILSTFLWCWRSKWGFHTCWTRTLFLGYM